MTQVVITKHAKARIDARLPPEKRCLDPIKNRLSRLKWRESTATFEIQMGDCAFVCRFGRRHKKGKLRGRVVIVITAYHRPKDSKGYRKAKRKEKRRGQNKAAPNNTE